MSLHTTVFGALAALLAVPSVAAVFAYALDSDAAMGLGTGLLFTYTAVACVALATVTVISAACDLLGTR